MIDPATLALQTVGGFMVGGLIGYALRKAAKWFLLLLGFMLLPIFGLWYLGLLYVNWAGVNALVAKIISWLGVNLSNMGLAIASMGMLGLGTLFGFFFGLTGGFRQSILEVFEDERENVKRFVKRKT